MKYVGYATVIAIMAVVSSVISGYAISVLWGWFIVPTFDLPRLSIPAAIGVALLMGYLTHQPKASDDDPEKSFGQKLLDASIMSVVNPSIALTVGWVVSRWM